MDARLEKLRELLKNQGLDAVVINKVENLHYFSGFTGDDTILVVSQKAAILITDFRYMEQARQQSKFFQLIEHSKGLLPKTAEVLMGLELKNIGFEGNALTYNDFSLLKKMLNGVDFKQAVELDTLRMIKDEQEIALLQKAVEISDRAYEHILTILRPGISEIEIAAELENCMRRLGSEKPAFTTIVASGERGSLPHGIATDKLIVDGDFVTMDFGAVYKGYHSDITRTVCVGSADDKQRKIYEIVLQAQLLGVEKVQIGSSGQAVDADVRRYIMDAGYGRFFGHGLGHSVGLEIHELPRLSPSSTCEHLEENMLVTVEPGIYLPGWGGIRIEDTVLVTTLGGRPLTQSNKQLVEIK
ncbi:M24 family metallopeptidase [Propionispira raffinosivorans]|uniref:M24 family metallopeptidase n=1 Tax=Propionispira raffinosivorans TaxID=86959 RepID=UPI00036A1957